MLVLVACLSVCLRSWSRDPERCNPTLPHGKIGRGGTTSRTRDLMPRRVLVIDNRFMFHLFSYAQRLESASTAVTCLVPGMPLTLYMTRLYCPAQFSTFGDSFFAMAVGRRSRNWSACLLSVTSTRSLLKPGTWLFNPPHEVR